MKTSKTIKRSLLSLFISITEALNHLGFLAVKVLLNGN